MMRESERTYWNGEPCEAEPVRVSVFDSGRFPRYWAKQEGIVGQEIDAIKVTYRGEVFYLDNRDGSGWAKVTLGRGSPAIAHREIEVDA